MRDGIANYLYSYSFCFVIASKSEFGLETAKDCIVDATNTSCDHFDNISNRPQSNDHSL